MVRVRDTSPAQCTVPGVRTYAPPRAVCRVVAMPRFTRALQPRKKRRRTHTPLTLPHGSDACRAAPPRSEYESEPPSRVLHAGTQQAAASRHGTHAPRHCSPVHAATFAARRCRPRHYLSVPPPRRRAASARLPPQRRRRARASALSLMRPRRTARHHAHRPPRRQRGGGHLTCPLPDV